MSIPEERDCVINKKIVKALDNIFSMLAIVARRDPHGTWRGSKSFFIDGDYVMVVNCEGDLLRLYTLHIICPLLTRKTTVIGKCLFDERHLGTGFTRVPVRIRCLQCTKSSTRTEAVNFI